MKLIFIHGIRTGPDSPVKHLIPFLSALYDTRYVDYGYELAIETRPANPMIEGSIFPFIDDGDIAIGHSNGCAIIYDLIAMKAPLLGAIFINGALQTNIMCPSWMKFMDVYWNQDDDVTEVARIGEEIGIYPRDWGQLGHSGYSGTDPKITSIDCGRTSGMPVVSGHSDFFNHLAEWGPFLVSRLQAHLEAPAT